MQFGMLKLTPEPGPVPAESGRERVRGGGGRNKWPRACVGMQEMVVIGERRQYMSVWT